MPNNLYLTCLLSQNTMCPLLVLHSLGKSLLTTCIFVSPAFLLTPNTPRLTLPQCYDRNVDVPAVSVLAPAV